MSVTIVGQNTFDTFRRIHIDHVFHCQTCQMFWLAKDLYRNQNRQYVCVRCGNSVEDITFTPRGQTFIQIVKGKTQ